MGEKARFRGGPFKGQTQPVNTGYAERVLVRAPLEDRMNWWDDPEPVVKMKEGHYARSNVTLKNGARVYVWMGWYDGTF